MRISVDNQELFALSEVQKKVIMNDISEDVFEDDMKRRLHYILMHKYERCLERLKLEWMPKLKSRVSSVPTDDDAFASLVFSQPEYMGRMHRDRADKAAQESKFRVE